MPPFTRIVWAVIHRACSVARNATSGATAAVGRHVLERAVVALRREAPAVSIAVRDVRTWEVAPMLRSRQADVVVTRTAGREPGLELIELPPTPAALAVPAGHRLAGHEAVDLARIDGERLLTWSPPGSAYTDPRAQHCRRAVGPASPAVVRLIRALRTAA